MDKKKMLFIVLIAIIFLKFLFNSIIFFLVVTRTDLIPQPYCSTCSRMCGFWKCLSINLDTGDSLLKDSVAQMNNDAARNLKIMEYILNVLFMVFELCVLVIFSCYYPDKNKIGVKEST